MESALGKNQIQLKNELQQLKTKIKSDPAWVFDIAQRCRIRAENILFVNGEILALLIMARCCWYQMDYRQGLKWVKEASIKQFQQETDEHLPEIFHLFALQYWGQAKYYSAQRYWIYALEQSSLIDDIEIQIESLIGLGNIWRITNEYSMAASAHELAVNVAKSARIAWLEGKARIMLAQDYHLLHKFFEMLTVLDDAADALKNHKDSTWQAEIWDFKGLALLGLGHLKAAAKATQKAQKIATEHNLTWMKAHSNISRARIERLRKDTESAKQFLHAAEELALNFDNGELLSQIYFQLSCVAEEQGNFEAAYHSFHQYRSCSLKMLKEQNHRISIDKARDSKRQLEQRANRLINRIRAQHEYNPEKHFSNLVPDTFWWEQLVVFKTELKSTNHSVIMISHSDPKVLDACTELINSFTTSNDLISRLSSVQLGILIAEGGRAAESFYQTTCTMLDNYPWEQRGITGPKPIVHLQDILAFPLTIEQLEERRREVMENGTTA